MPETDYSSQRGGNRQGHADLVLFSDLCCASLRKAAAPQGRVPVQHRHHHSDPGEKPIEISCRKQGQLRAGN